MAMIPDLMANVQKTITSFQANMQAQRMAMMGQRSTLFQGFGQRSTSSTTTGTKPEGFFGFGILPFAKLGFMSNLGAKSDAYRFLRPAAKDNSSIPAVHQRGRTQIGSIGN